MSAERNNLALRQQTLVNEIRSIHSAPKTLSLNPENDSETSIGFAVHQTEGLRIYQNNLKAIAYRALSIAYPVLEQLIGDQALRLLALQLIQLQPLRSGDWGDWGESLATLIEASEMINDYPFLTDIAVLEWHIHCANRSKDNEFDRDSLTLLEQHPLDSVHIELSESTRQFNSHYPIDTIWQLHQPQSPEQRQALKDQLQQELNQVDSHFRFLVTKKEYQARIRRLSDQDALWFSSVFSGESLEELLTELPAFNFPDWLKNAIENNYLTRFFTPQNSV